MIPLLGTDLRAELSRRQADLRELKGLVRSAAVMAWRHLPGVPEWRRKTVLT